VIVHPLLWPELGKLTVVRLLAQWLGDRACHIGGFYRPISEPSRWPPYEISISYGCRQGRPEVGNR
jgi:hypothetical protein